jgi:hypothetical protein
MIFEYSSNSKWYVKMLYPIFSERRKLPIVFSELYEISDLNLCGSICIPEYSVVSGSRSRIDLAVLDPVPDPKAEIDQN